MTKQTSLTIKTNMIKDPNEPFSGLKEINTEIYKALTIANSKAAELFKNHEIDLNFADTELMISLNKEYRGKDYLTDVLSWNFFEDGQKPLAHEVLGEIVISKDKALIQAKELNISLEERVIFLIIHGCLHVMGYDHIDEKEAEIMEELEERIYENCKKSLAK